MTTSEFLESLFASFVNLRASALLVMLISIAVIVGLLVIWRSWLGRIAAQEERDWDWLESVERLEPLEREFERKSSLDAVPVLNEVQGNDEPNDAVQDLDEAQAVDAVPVLNEVQGNDEPNDAVQDLDEAQAVDAVPVLNEVQGNDEPNDAVQDLDEAQAVDAVPVLNEVQGNDEPNDAVQDLDEAQAVDAMPVLNEVQGNDEPNDEALANDASEDIADAFAELRRLLAEAKIPTDEDK